MSSAKTNVRIHYKISIPFTGGLGYFFFEKKKVTPSRFVCAINVWDAKNVTIL
jgi:hypothetical protein